MVALTAVAFVLAFVAAFLGFRDILPGALSLLMRVLFVVSALTGLVAFNVILFRRPGTPPGSEPPKQE